MKTTIEFYIFELVKVLKLFNKLYWFYKQISQKKGYFRSKTEKMNITIELFIFELVYVLNFSLNWHLRFFGPNLPKNGKQVFPVKNREGERHHCFLYIQISLGSKFSLNWQFKFFGPNLSKEGISGLKTKKVNITIKFCIL